MAIYASVRIAGPETYRLADLSGVLEDLAWVIQACDILLPRLATLNENAVELEALESAAIVRYMRCFVGGARTAFVLNDDWIAKLSPELQAAHERAHARRDKHIAHSVNDWELNVVNAQLRIDGAAKTKKVVAVSVAHHRMLGLGDPDVEALRNLARCLRDAIARDFEAERVRILNIAPGDAGGRIGAAT